jgi:hypothetical protein
MHCSFYKDPHYQLILLTLIKSVQGEEPHYNLTGRTSCPVAFERTVRGTPKVGALIRGAGTAR